MTLNIVYFAGLWRLLTGTIASSDTFEICPVTQANCVSNQKKVWIGKPLYATDFLCQWLKIFPQHYLSIFQMSENGSMGVCFHNNSRIMLSTAVESIPFQSSIYAKSFIGLHATKIMIFCWGEGVIYPLGLQWASQAKF